MARAKYAADEKRSAGRRYREDSPRFRSEYQRDRDRIIHSSAFRRLEYKTQVFLNHEGDMFRTRLTHSIEVAQIGRSIARALSLNEDLTEAICLAHDLGHTPFGHAGQDALNECMREFGGFEHNLQSVRVVDILEEKYAAFPGLNLMFETREGILKHCSRTNARKLGALGDRFINGGRPGLEAQVADLADEIAYNNHDVDDGLRAGLITIQQLNECALFREHYEQVTALWPELSGRRLIHEVVRRMINGQVCDVIESSKRRIRECAPRGIDDVRSAGVAMACMSEGMRKKHHTLKRFLRDNLYSHYRVSRMTHKARKVIKVLFESFAGEPELLPDEVRRKMKRGSETGESAERFIADYIAGMTDRYAIAEYDRISTPQDTTF
jgi:dGTPase